MVTWFELLTNYQWEANGGNGYSPCYSLHQQANWLCSVLAFLDEYKASKAQPGFSNQFIINLESGK